MRIYLAGPWARKPDVREARTQFQAAGIIVQADWIDHHNGAHTEKELQTEAYRDLMQINEADGIVVLQLEKSEGKSAEMMYAYCNYLRNPDSWYDTPGKRPIIVVGEHDVHHPVNVFHYLPGITRVHTIEEAIHALRHSRPAQQLATRETDESRRLEL